MGVVQIIHYTTPRQRHLPHHHEDLYNFLGSNKNILSKSSLLISPKLLYQLMARLNMLNDKDTEITPIFAKLTVQNSKHNYNTM